MQSHLFRAINISYNDSRSLAGPLMGLHGVA